MWYREKVSIKLWPDMATSPEAPDHNASELCRATVLQQAARHFNRSDFQAIAACAEQSSHNFREDDMYTAIAATAQTPLLLPRVARMSGSSQYAASLPMSYTVGGWVESSDTNKFSGAAGSAACIAETAATVNADEPRRLYRNMAAILRSLGKLPVDATEDGVLRLALPAEQLNFECVQAPAARTMADIFEGHHRIAEAMRSQDCEGRWQIWINRHYCDEEPIEEVLACMSTMPLRAAATGVLPSCPKGVGVVVTKYQPSSAERIHRRSVLPLYDIHTQRPKSLIMSGGLSLHIEGPFFHRCEPMEALLHSHRQHRGTAIIVIGSDEPGEYNDNARQMQILLDEAPPAIGGIVVLQPGNGKRSSAAIAGVYTRRTVDVPLLAMLARCIKK